MLRKVLFTVLLFCPSVVWGQLLSVTATLTDPDSIVWANGTCSVQVYSPNGAPFFNSTPVPTAPQACSINGSGVLSTSIYNTSTITPLGAQYRFSINSATSAPGSSFLTPVTAANMTSTLSSQLVAPRFSAAVAFAYGYADVEAVATNPGGQYYKTTSTAGQRIWSGSAWTSGGGGGGSGCTAIGAAGIVQASNGSGICQATTINDTGSGITTTEPVTINSTATASFTANSSASSAGAAAYGFSVVGASSMAFVNFGTGNGAGLAGVLGLLDNVTSIFPWMVNSTDTICFGTPIAGGNVNNCTGAVATISPDGVGNFIADVKINGAHVPALDTATPTANGVACIKAAGPPVSLGVCTSVVGAGGACTCS